MKTIDIAKLNKRTSVLCVMEVVQHQIDRLVKQDTLKITEIESLIDAVEFFKRIELNLH